MLNKKWAKKEIVGLGRKSEAEEKLHQILLEMNYQLTFFEAQDAFEQHLAKHDPHMIWVTLDGTQQGMAHIKGLKKSLGKSQPYLFSLPHKDLENKDNIFVVNLGPNYEEDAISKIELLIGLAPLETSMVLVGESVLHAKDKNITELSDQKKEYEGRLNDLEQDISKLRLQYSQAQGFQSDLNKMTEKYKNIESAKKEFESISHQLKTELDQTQQEFKKIKKSYEDLKQTVQKAKDLLS